MEDKIQTATSGFSQGCDDTVETFFHSTRSCAESVTGKFAIRTGIAPDGGLYIRDDLADKPLDLAKVCGQSFQETALEVLGTLFEDYTAEEIASCVSAAYGPSFDDARITPVRQLGRDWMLELFHGPTCAFKDVALQILPHLMNCAREKDSDRILVLTATSGDTGKAALEGFADVDNIGICVFYPYGKVSDVQELQMVCQEGSNVGVCAVRGTFDDAQTGVKRIFTDADLVARFAEQGISLSSANSINIGRLAPQITYYFDAYAQLVRAGAIALGDEVEFVVPTGNFGDVLAGYYAKLLGLPVGRLVVASNANNVLTDFITTGTYDRIRPFEKTISPSMDILVSSNLERLLYHLSGDADYVAGLMDELARTGSYTVSDELLSKIQELFGCGFATDAQCAEAIRYTFERTGILIDPHTAVGKYVMDDMRPSGRARVLLSTASPFKFPADCLAALGARTEGLDGFSSMDELARIAETSAPAALSRLRTLPRLHDDACAIDAMPGFVEDFAGEVFA